MHSPARPVEIRVNELSSHVLERARRGDPAAVGELVEWSTDRVWRTCRNLLGNDADAEDATQEVLLRMLDRLGRFEGRSKFRTWLYRLTVRHCLNWIDKRDRRQRRFRSLDEAGSEPADHRADAEADSAQRREVTQALLREVDAPSRAILVLREVEGLDYREIATALDVPIGTVMSRLSRARKKLWAAARRVAPRMEVER